ncbi:MAG: hypothetical protein ABH846_03120, partial [Patescibacteria group bacterium]
SLVKIEYPKSDGTTGTSSGALTGNERTFQGLDFFVENNNHGEVGIYVNVAATDRATGSATSNEEIRMALTDDNTNLDQIRSRGQSSGTTLNDDDFSTIDKTDAANTDQATFVVKETRPTITRSSSSPSGSGYVPGDMEVFRFNVAVHSNEDFILEEMIFDMSSTDNASTATLWNYCDDSTTDIYATDFDLYNLTTTGTSTALDVDADWMFLAADGEWCNTGTDGEQVEYVVLDLTTRRTVSAGATNSFALYFDSTGASASADDSVQFSIPQDPIVWFDSGLTLAADPTSTATSFTASGAISAANSAAYDFSPGDVICLTAGTCATTDERLLVTSVTTPAFTAVRGYLGSTNVDQAGNEKIYVSRGTLLWQDDGNAATTATGDLWGAYLVDDLPVTGYALGF